MFLFAERITPRSLFMIGERSSVLHAPPRTASIRFNRNYDIQIDISIGTIGTFVFRASASIKRLEDEVLGRNDAS